MEASFKPEFGYVALATGASYLVHHIWMSSQVMQARRKYEVKYPHLYADEKNCPNEQNRNAFNCVQRAHQNSLENQPIAIALWTLAGLKHPVTSAVGAAIYLLGRIFYFKGYSSGDPEKRMRGSIMYVGLLCNLGCVFKIAWDLLSRKA